MFHPWTRLKPCYTLLLSTPISFCPNFLDEGTPHNGPPSTSRHWHRLHAWNCSHNQHIEGDPLHQFFINCHMKWSLHDHVFECFRRPSSSLWRKLKPRCQGIKELKKNKMTNVHRIQPKLQTGTESRVVEQNARAHGLQRWLFPLAVQWLCEKTF